MSASSLLATLAQARGQLATLRLAPLELIRAEAELHLETFGPVHEAARQRRIAIQRELLGKRSSERGPIQGVTPVPDVAPAPVVRPTGENEDTTVDHSVEPIEELDLLGDDLSVEPAEPSVEPAELSVEPSGEATVDATVEEYPTSPLPGFEEGTQPLDELTEVSPDSIPASAEDIADLLDSDELADALSGTLDDDLTGLEDEDSGELPELSLSELEASDLLDDEPPLDLLGDDDSIDEGALLAPIDPIDSLAEDEPVPGSEEEVQGLDPALHPDALSLDADLLEPLSQDLPLDLDGDIAPDEDEDDADLADAFGDHEDDGLGELVDDDDEIEAALFEVEGGRGAGVDSAQLREVPAEHAKDALPDIIPTIKDRTSDTPVGAAAAIQLNADGSSMALMGDDEENIEVEMPEADEDEYDDLEHGEGGLNLSYVDEVEYVEEEESEAPELDHAGNLETLDNGQDLTGADFHAMEEVDSVAVANLEAAAAEALDRGDLHAAVQAWSDMLEHDPSNMEAYLGRGRAHLDLGDFAAAMSDFQKAEDQDREGPEPLVAMGELFFARKEYTRAIEFFDQAVEMDNDHAMARCRRGISYYYKKSYRQAFLDLQKAYTLDPDIPNIRKYVQMAIKKLERSGESI